MQAHQDRVKQWHQMMYEEQLNKWCNEMAKEAIEWHLAVQIEATIEERELEKELSKYL